MTRLVTIAAAAALLAGCGLKGDLETPAPLWGDPNREPAARNLPSDNGEKDRDRVIFTRDDVDLFRNEDEVEDAFADVDAAAEAEAQESQTAVDDKAANDDDAPDE